jgi:hypothetical protein
MNEYALNLSAIFGFGVLLYLCRPLIAFALLPLWGALIQRRLARYSRQECAFETITNEAQLLKLQESFAPELKELRELNFEHLLSWSNLNFQKEGAESLSVAWRSTSGETVCCLSWIALPPPPALLRWMLGSCSNGLSQPALSATFESSTEDGSRLFTVRINFTMPPLPTHYHMIALNPDCTLIEGYDRHQHELKVFQERTNSALVRYTSGALLLRHQRIQHKELHTRNA